MRLETAIRSGDLAAAVRLLREGADPNRSGPEGLTPLMVAAGLGQPNMVEILLTAGSNVLAIEPRMGASALHKAALSGNCDVAELLLDYGAFIDQQSPILGHTALMDAVVYKQTGLVSLLLRRGARASIRNHWGETALDIAQRDELSDISGMLTAHEQDRKAWIDAQPLVTALRNGDLSGVMRLIDTGADIDIRLPMIGSPDDNYTPLAIAARDGQADIVLALLRAGADPRRTIGLFGGTVLHEACYFGHGDVVRLMAANHERLDRRASELDAQGALNGMTPLHDAVWHGHHDAAQALIAAGARLDLRTHAGLTPRELAILYGYDELAQSLADAEEKCRANTTQDDAPCDS
ncbi:ankyrin repeat domain-containing protein [Roseovarius sp.]|uniref:ankyrin repeat domain-containing protein n=1 Tax=Roseovarius sp. TaxID=1486281 RepID=UPI003B58B7D1